MENDFDIKKCKAYTEAEYDNLYHIYFNGLRTENVYNNLKETVNKDIIDFSCSEEHKYINYTLNKHHIHTKYYIDNIIPKLEDILHFGFNVDDFRIVPHYSCDGRNDLSYLYPKDDSNKYTVQIYHEEIKGLFNVLMSIDNFTTENKEQISAYHKLFVGAHSCCRIINEGKNNGKMLLVSGDSMLIPVMPILYYYYKIVTYLDNRDNSSHQYFFKNMRFNDGIIEFYDDNKDNKDVIRKLDINFY